VKMRAWLGLLLAIACLGSARLPLPPLHPGLRNLLSELPGLQCLPNERGCSSRRRARPGGLFPRGRGLPPIPRVRLQGPKSPPRLTQRVLPPWKAPLPRVVTLAPWHPGVSTQVPAEARQFQAASEALEAGKRAYWRGIPQDHFRNLSPNARNHRYGREVALSKPESRQAVKTKSFLDVSIKIPVTTLPERKRKSYRVSKTVTTSTSSKSQSIGSKQSEYGSNFPTSVPDVIENSIDRTFITPTTVVKHKLVPLTTSTFSKPSQSPVKTYYDAIFTKPTSPASKRPNTPHTVFFNRNRSRTKTTTVEPVQEITVIYPTSEPKQTNEQEEDPEISHFSPTPRPKRSGKGKKFFRHSLPLSIVDNYKDIEVKNKKLVAKSSDKIAEEIIALFKS